MAIRSFQQIMDAHEAAQEMLRSLEVDVRDTLADAKAELERFRSHVVALAPKAYYAYKAGDTFVMVRNDDSSVTVGSTYVLWPEYPGYIGLCFHDNNGYPRHFYDWWLTAD